MKCVAVESPYNGPTEADIKRNIRYARACMHDCLMRGEAPFASHLLYTQPGILNDRIPEERSLGIEAGLAIEAAMQHTVVYTNLGLSNGMKYGIQKAEKAGRTVEYRTLPDDWDSAEHPTREGW